MSRLRVAERVAHGGHSIPEEDIIRCFPRSLYNLLHVFEHKVNQVQCYMNSGSFPELVFQQEGSVRTVYAPDLLKPLQRDGSIMSINSNPLLSPSTQATLDCLRQAVSKTLERKRRLGHYSVQWSGGRIFAVGDDAPKHLLMQQVAVDQETKNTGE